MNARKRIAATLAMLAAAATLSLTTTTGAANADFDPIKKCCVKKH